MNGSDESAAAAALAARAARLAAARELAQKLPQTKLSKGLGPAKVEPK